MKMSLSFNGNNFNSLTKKEMVLCERRNVKQCRKVVPSAFFQSLFEQFPLKTSQFSNLTIATKRTDIKDTQSFRTRRNSHFMCSLK